MFPTNLTAQFPITFDFYADIKLLCVYCERHNNANQCKNYPTHVGRWNRCWQKNLCQLCLKNHGQRMYCATPPKPCYYCGQFNHHLSLCHMSPFLKASSFNFRSRANQMGRVNRKETHHHSICRKSPKLKENFKNDQQTEPSTALSESQNTEEVNFLGALFRTCDMDSLNSVDTRSLEPTFSENLTKPKAKSKILSPTTSLVSIWLDDHSKNVILPPQGSVEFKLRPPNVDQPRLDCPDPKKVEQNIDPPLQTCQNHEGELQNVDQPNPDDKNLSKEYQNVDQPMQKRKKFDWEKKVAEAFEILRKEEELLKWIREYMALPLEWREPYLPRESPNFEQSILECPESNDETELACLQKIELLQKYEIPLYLS